MKQVFISAVALQSRNGLRQVVYKPYDLSFDSARVTSFPIVPVIEHYMSEPEDTFVILLRSGNTQMADNYEIMKEEIISLGVVENHIYPLKMEARSGKQECVKMLLSLIDMIEDGSEVYTDITFQTKPIAASMLYAMNIVENLKDVEVGGIFYGEIDSWSDNNISGSTGILYDITVFKFMSEIAGQLKLLGVSDTRDLLEKLCGDQND